MERDEQAGETETMGREMVDTRKEAEATREMQGDVVTLREKQKTDGRGDTETEKTWRARSVVRGGVTETPGSRHAPRGAGS